MLPTAHMSCPEHRGKLLLIASKPVEANDLESGAYRGRDVFRQVRQSYDTPGAEDGWKLAAAARPDGCCYIHAAAAVGHDAVARTAGGAALLLLLLLLLSDLLG